MSKGYYLKTKFTEDYNRNILRNLNQKISESSFLITGGAGFIGSNIVNYLMNLNAKKVRVLDNLSNGSLINIEKHFGKKNFEFIEDDICNFETCINAVSEINYISHQAALGSVPRSIKDPIKSNEANVTGFLNILTAAKESKSLVRMVYAASSSTYGDSTKLPKTEGEEGNPLSPYAVTKLINELYAEVFSKVYNFHTIGLRYFNVFGPNQSPSNPYAAVIPIFCKNFVEGIRPTINGDGSTSRDFTYIDNAVQANILALMNSQKVTGHDVFNVACGERATLLEIIELLEEISHKSLSPVFAPEREGDVKHSKANINKIKSCLGYSPKVYLQEGLKSTFNWINQNR